MIKAKRAIRAMTAKISIKKYVHVQSVCFALITPIAFFNGLLSVLVTVFAEAHQQRALPRKTLTCLHANNFVEI